MLAIPLSAYEILDKCKASPAATKNHCRIFNAPATSPESVEEAGPAPEEADNPGGGARGSKSLLCNFFLLSIFLAQFLL